MNAKEFLQNGEYEKVRNVIAQVKGDILRTILTEHYIENLKWDGIAAELHYTSRHIQRLHRKALAAVQDILNDQ